MTTKSMMYDAPAYLARQSFVPPAQVAGASKTYDKFVAFTASIVLSASLPKRMITIPASKSRWECIGTNQ